MAKEERNFTYDQLLGKKLRIRRKQLQKSQPEIEHAASISHSHLGRIE